MEFRWALVGPGEPSTEGPAAAYRAPAEEGDARIVAAGRQADIAVGAEAAVQVRETTAAAGLAAGVPEPQPVNASSEPWRSRVAVNARQYNKGHPDCLAIAADEQRRLRYLIHLFIKELVLRNFGSPADGELPERMCKCSVTWATAAPTGPEPQRELRGSRGPGRDRQLAMVL